MQPTSARNASARQRAAARRVPSISTQTARQCFSAASQRMARLSDEEISAWRAYAATQTKIDPETGIARPRQWDKVCVGLLARFLHLNKTWDDYPRTPPLFPFAGDPISVTAQAAEGVVVFTATGPTSPHVRVELLLQTLPSPARSPQPGRYRHRQFVSFAPGALSVTVETGRGWFIPAYRFVHVETGQDTPLIPLPKATVG